MRTFGPVKPEDVLVDEVWYRSSYSPIFDEAWYLTTYPDVAEAVRSGRAKSGYDHFIERGYAEGRKPSRYGGIALGEGERQPLPRHSRKR